jgi:hypothetical protein
MFGKNILMKKLFFCLFAIIISVPATAQFYIPGKSLCEQLKSRTVIVQLTGDTTADLVMRNAFKKYWTLTPVEFLTKEQFNQAVTIGDIRYAALMNSFGESSHTIVRFDTKLNTTEERGTFYFGHYDYSLCLLTGSNTNTKICSVTFAFDKLITSDFLFVVQQISRLVNASLNNISGTAYYDPKKNIEFVKTKTLLIPKELFKEKELAEVSKIYTFPHKVVSMSELNELVLNEDETYIYPKIIFCEQHNFYGWITISAKDGSITSIMTFGGIQVSAVVQSDEAIKVKDLKYITSGFAQGINNKYK